MSYDKPLTSAQLHYCRAWASGLSQSQAYREAFEVSPETKAKTVHEKASRLSANPKVRARYERLIAAREAGMVASALSDREMVRKHLRDLALTASPQDSGRLRALELLGRASGAFVELHAEVDARSSADLLAELDAMLDSATASDMSDADDFDFSQDRPDTMDIH
jgi:cytidylate kinase